MPQAPYCVIENNAPSRLVHHNTQVSTGTNDSAGPPKKKKNTAGGDEREIFIIRSLNKQKGINSGATRKTQPHTVGVWQLDNTCHAFESRRSVVVFTQRVRDSASNQSSCTLKESIHAVYGTHYITESTRSRVTKYCGTYRICGRNRDNSTGQKRVQEGVGKLQHRCMKRLYIFYIYIARSSNREVTLRYNTSNLSTQPLLSNEASHQRLINIHTYIHYIQMYAISRFSKIEKRHDFSRDELLHHARLFSHEVSPHPSSYYHFILHRHQHSLPLMIQVTYILVDIYKYTQGLLFLDFFFFFSVIRRREVQL